ncbi:hypothetical protein Q9966_015128 [Columba livia]|nr:hypothetical protein Q9966_015128 [Columba livia]
MGPKGEAGACRNEGPPVGPRSPPALPGKVAVRGVCGRGRCAVRARPVTRPDLRSGSHLWASGGREAGVAGAKRLAAASRGAEEEFLTVSALNSGEAGARCGAGQGGSRAGSPACSRGASPQRRRRGSGTSARRLCCFPPADAPSRLHASPAAAAPGGCGSFSSLQLSGDCAWLQVWVCKYSATSVRSSS